MNLPIRRAVFWAIWAGFAGVLCRVLLVLTFRWTQSGLVHELIFSAAFRPQIVLADAITRRVFPGDLMHRVVDIAKFYDGAISVALGLEFGIFGFGLALVVEHLRTIARNRIT